MAAPMTSPVVSPMHYDPSFKVDIQLHQPLLQRAATPGSIRLEMMSLCFQLDTLCKKELVEQGSIQNGHVSNSFIDRASLVYDKILQQLGMVPPEYQDCLQYLRTQGLDKLYPRAATYLANPQHFSLESTKTSLDNYLNSVSSLSQLSTLARQLHNDCINPASHKYIAHQLAILYQTLSSMKSTVFSQHKQSIEEMFKPIKAALATTQEGQVKSLTDQQQEWLLNLTNHLLNTLNSFPPELTQEMLEPAALLSRTC